MAESCSDKTTVFDYQVDACNEFFHEELRRGEFKLIANEDRPDNMKLFKGPICDMTGLDAQKGVLFLMDIMNNKCPSRSWKNNKTFYLWIRGKPRSRKRHTNLEELFRLKARPTTDQPGNGILKVRPRGRKTYFKESVSTYEGLGGALEAHYKTERFTTDTASFAKHIKQLFKNNAKIDDIPQATIEVYMTFLFAIARRLVTTENPSEKKEKFDVLPIGSAIAGLLKLLELGKCRFEDVFHSTGKFHCFTGGPDVRRKAIDNINKALLGELQMTKECHLNELRELFCSEEQPEEEENGYNEEAEERTGSKRGVDRQKLLCYETPGEITLDNSKRFSLFACLSPCLDFFCRCFKGSEYRNGIQTEV